MVDNLADKGEVEAEDGEDIEFLVGIFLGQKLRRTCHIALCSLLACFRLLAILV